MLVLESPASKRWFSPSAVCSLLVVMVATCCTPQIGVARNDAAGNESESEANSDTVSILVGKESSDDAGVSSELTSAANGLESIDGDSAGNATYTAQSLSPSPRPPQDMLIPESPSEKSFTSPLANGLRGEAIAASETPSEDKPILGGLNHSKDDGTEARGTFASTSQSYQAQPNSGGGLTGKVSNQFGPTSPPANSHFGPPIGTSQNTGQLSSSPPFSTGSPIMTGATPRIAPPMSGQPGEWRDIPTMPGNNSGSDSANARFQSTSVNQGPMNGSLQPVAPPVRSANAQFENTYNAPVSRPLIRQGSDVQPVGFNQPVARVESVKSNIELAKTLMARYEASSGSAQNLGRPTKLIEMVQQPISPQLKRPMIHQYWESYYDWANYESDRQYEQWLKRLPGATSAVDKSRLAASLVVAANRTLSSEIQLGRSQAGLLQYMPTWSRTQPLPIPVDTPLIQKYRTNYDLYSDVRQMPNRLRGIDQMLPKTLVLIGQRARAVQVTKQAADATLAGLNVGQARLDEVLSAGRRWRDSERDLIASVVSYNQAISDYALSVAPTNQTPQQVVAMLIGRPRATVAQAAPISTRQPQVSAQPPRKSSVLAQSSFPSGGGAPRQPTASPTTQFGSDPGASRGAAGTTSVLSGQPPQQPGNAASKFSLDAENGWSNRSKPAGNIQGAPPVSPFGGQPKPKPTSSGSESNSFGASNSFGPGLPGQ